MREYDLRKLIYSALAAELRGEAIIDSDNMEFCEELYVVQSKMAKEFDKRAEGAPPIPD